MEKIQTVLFSDEEKAQLPPALAAQLATTREQIADLAKAQNSPDPVASLCASRHLHVLGWGVCVYVSLTRRAGGRSRCWCWRSARRRA